MQMTTLTDIITEVCRDPRNIALRGIAADALEEAGQSERAEFVRCQVQIAQLQAALKTRYEDADLCTGVSANWCPVCGDCCCRNPEDRKDDADCPLHNSLSRHAGDDSVKAVLESLRRRERELLREPAPGTLGGAGGTVCRDCSWHLPIPHGGFSWELRRGFVEQVTCTLRDWYGELCFRCIGRGKWPAQQPQRYVDGIVTCQTCSGTGRLTGHGPQIVACQPIVELNLTDMGTSGAEASNRDFLNWARRQHGWPDL